MPDLDAALDAENKPPVETQEFDLNMDFTSGDQVIVHVAFPAQKAILAVTALREIGTEDYITRLLSAFRNDPSVAAKLKESGLSFERVDDEDE